MEGFGKAFKRIAERARMMEDERSTWLKAREQIKKKFEGKSFRLYYDMFLNDEITLSHGTQTTSETFTLKKVGQNFLRFIGKGGTEVRVDSIRDYRVEIFDMDRIGFKLTSPSVHIYFFKA